MDVDTTTSGAQGLGKHPLPEREMYCYMLVLIFLIDQRNTMRILLELHRMATLRRDELGQVTLLNLLLRNYLHYNLYDQPEKLRSKAPHFEAHSNQQACSEKHCFQGL
ncbi:hypothetical protein IHE45_07G072100 [Dioscorea alata]|uniref:Uncharacterized protein n=2 Tax=Dioscorea alata TaxID=55571 RepID=A0ACB7VS38_DIOAL|nr:hypothetical protein IHE45_07G072100 [Dioscorea alata]KAH7677268.1 hypothetical protein IHE45_07G072100 [Dioscorea alata]